MKRALFLLLMAASMDLTAAPVTKTKSVVNKNPLTADIEQKAKSETPAYTGRICRNKVRIRLQASLDSPVFHEARINEMYVIDGEENDFLALQAPSNTKAFIFRTFVLDNVIEGDRVNVRLEPSLDAPVIAQLDTGTKIDGYTCESNNKWIEIPIPSSARFWVAKEYIERVGDENYLTMIKQRKAEVSKNLHTAFLLSQSELGKSFEEINVQAVKNDFDKIIQDCSDCPEHVLKARELVSKFEANYLQKKIAHLEIKVTTPLLAQNMPPVGFESLVENTADFEVINTQANTSVHNLAVWEPMEQIHFENWANNENNSQGTREQFYMSEKENSSILIGILEPYSKPIKNKPGDFVLLNPTTRTPIAYLYSTVVNLHERAGKETKVLATPRPNNNFAYPAYHTLSVE
jgi:uncharacterized protein YgiM (DUF1202 family)